MESAKVGVESTGEHKNTLNGLLGRIYHALSHVMAHILLAHKLTYYGYTVDTLWKSIDRTGAGNLLQKEWPLEGESEGSEIDYLCTLYTLYTLYTYILIYYT